ncbi:class I SAM-dependent methyltransferase [Embleya sp. NBC_00888]|uniref:class I SAM-dependent methyltransferase n=1 Tax=Embleya sp. NBC_00888 TaxID=2975960 RepID=UPI003862F6EA|nr:class I SAM-dependent methyltransferase [Embleya sp. NBC_00888]
MTERRFDTWALGDAYERYMGRWSRAVAAEFVAWLDADAGLRWVDAGCGTGALTATVVDRCRPRWVLGLDRSAGFVARARAAVPAPAGFVVADALALPVRDAACDVLVGGLVLNFLPAPDTAVLEATRVVRPGGLVAGYVWDYAEGMGLLRWFWGAAGAVDPVAARWDEGRRFTVCRPDRLRALWSAAGLVDVSVVPIEVVTGFADFDDLWEPFLAGQGPAPGYVAALSPPARDRLREALRAAVPTRADGSITLTARAWAIRGTRAGD